LLRPAGCDLPQNYPNPFDPPSTLQYGLPETTDVKLTIYNALGQQISVPQDGEQDAWYRDIQFNASQVASGVYFYELRAYVFTATK
jgi:hypothetical protein